MSGGWCASCSWWWSEGGPWSHHQSIILIIILVLVLVLVLFFFSVDLTTRVSSSSPSYSRIFSLLSSSLHHKILILVDLVFALDLTTRGSSSSSSSSYLYLLLISPPEYHPHLLCRWSHKYHHHPHPTKDFCTTRFWHSMPLSLLLILPLDSYILSMSNCFWW